MEGLDHEVAAAHPYYTDSEDEDYYEAIAASRAQYRPNLSLGRDGCWPALLRAAAGSRLTPSPAAFFRRNVRTGGRRWPWTLTFVGSFSGVALLMRLICVASVFPAR